MSPSESCPFQKKRENLWFLGITFGSIFPESGVSSKTSKNVQILLRLGSFNTRGFHQVTCRPVRSQSSFHLRPRWEEQSRCLPLVGDMETPKTQKSMAKLDGMKLSLKKCTTPVASDCISLLGDEMMSCQPSNDWKSRDPKPSQI